MVVNQPGTDDQSMTSTVDAREASTADAHFRMGIGRLKLRGGASRLMEAHFTFNEDLKPRVNYAVHDGRGALEVLQPKSVRNLRLRGSRNRWDVRLNDSVPLDLTIDLAAGEAEIDAASLSLATFALDSSAGQSEVDLGGEQPLLTSVDLEVSAGKLVADLTGRYSALRDLRVECSAGQVELDLAGRWEADLDARIDTSAGEIKLRLPRDVYVEADARTTLGHVSAFGLTRAGDLYVSSDVTSGPVLRLKVRASIGHVILQAAE
jgi:hypothetical protein